MIINTEKSNVQVIGDIREFKTSIDPKNLEYITTLLSSNLYSKPEQSFIREIVSNAWDSHVEAGTIDTPIIIKFTKIGNNTEVTIRDFGTGLSPERFQEVYCNIGSSTKRESNEFIGGFGIGKYSSLACSNTVYITSYYEGKAYIYVMVKSGNSITTNLVIEKLTEEKNGVEVTIKNIDCIAPYVKALNYIVFFPNVFIDGVTNDINTTKIKKFNNFAVASKVIDTKILLGNVLYPCAEKQLSKESRDFLYNIEDSGIVIKFNVGELNITPNRENIIYTRDTLDKIEKKIQAAKIELDNLVKAKCVKDYKNLYDYWKISYYPIIYDPIEDNYIINTKRWCNYNVKGYHTKVNENDLTFKESTVLNNNINTLSIFFNMQIINFKGLFHNNKLYQAKVPVDSKSRILMGIEPLLILTGNTRLTKIAKDWLYKRYKEYTIVTKFNKEELKSYLINNITYFRNNPNKDILVEYLYDYLISKAVLLNLEEDKDFQAFKAKEKKSETPISRIKDFILHIQRNNVYKEKRHFKDLDTCIKYLKDLEKGIILTDMQGDEMWYDISRARNFVFIKAKKEVVNTLKEMKLSFLVDTTWLLKDDPVIIKLHTILQTFKDKESFSPAYSSNSEILNTIPSPLKEEISEMMSFYCKYKDNYSYILLARQECTKIDPYVNYLCKKLKYYRDTYNTLCNDLDIRVRGTEDIESVLMVGAILKSKSYRINPEAYNKFNNNKLLKVLCRK